MTAGVDPQRSLPLTARQILSAKAKDNNLLSLDTRADAVVGRMCRVPEECSEAVADLIAACMEADPADRPSAREIVEMLSATGNERALQSAADRRKEARAEVCSRLQTTQWCLYLCSVSFQVTPTDPFDVYVCTAWHIMYKYAQRSCV